MIETKRATEAAPYLHKDKQNSIIRQVQSLFLSGGRYTAVEINAVVGFNDARRVISTLRNDEAMNIKDIRLSDGRKQYWLERDERQLSLFGGEENV